jgi:hypothetical protein
MDLCIFFLPSCKGKGGRISLPNFMFSKSSLMLLIWFLVNHFGLLGAAASWDIMVAFEALLLFAAARFHPARLLQLIPPLGFILAAYLYVCISPPAILNAFLAAGILAAGVGVCSLIFDANAREFVASWRIPGRSQSAE